MNNLELFAKHALCRIKSMLENNEFEHIDERHKVLWQYILSQINDRHKPMSHEKFYLKQQKFIKKQPQFSHNINFMAKIISNYPNLLANRIQFIDLMFVNGDFTTIENLYINSPEMNYYNKLTSKLASKRIKYKDNILELGAGIGATSQGLLPLIHNKISSYHYTDISKIFTYYAKKKIKPNYSKVDCFNYNINNFPSVSMQNTYDIIISTDALHNATDIVQTLKYIHLCLKTNGLLIINELTKPSLYSNIIYGLTPEWWINNDEYRIDSSPVLSSENWKKLLSVSGFKNTSIKGRNRSYSHNVIISQKA